MEKYSTVSMIDFKFIIDEYWLNFYVVVIREVVMVGRGLGLDEIGLRCGLILVDIGERIMIVV